MNEHPYDALENRWKEKLVKARIARAEHEGSARIDGSKTRSVRALVVAAGAGGLLLLAAVVLWVVR